MHRLSFAVLALLAAPIAHASPGRIHVSALQSLSAVAAVCAPVGLTDSTVMDSHGKKLRNDSHLWQLESHLDTIVTAVSIDLRVFRDSACENPLTDHVVETDIDDDGDGTGGSASKIDAYFIEDKHSADDLVYVRAVLNAGTANGYFVLFSVPM